MPGATDFAQSPLRKTPELIVTCIISPGKLDSQSDWFGKPQTSPRVNENKLNLPL